MDNEKWTMPEAIGNGCKYKQLLSILHCTLSIKKGAAKAAPFYQVVFMNFSRHLGQVMEIFPLPLGTLTC